jgi:L-ascorbate metabolism protein UlaG (beta-lactamase superfamily)
MKPIFRKAMWTFFALIALLALAGALILNQNQFGKLPSGDRLKRIQQSPNFRDGAFHNISPTQMMSQDVSYFSLLKESIFDRDPRATPNVEIPSVKTNLLGLDKNEDVLVWFGHSSYFMQIDGKKILVDPVLSTHASPFSFSVKAFSGTNVYSAEDIPEIDYLFISHDHWDHLDYDAIMALKPKIKKVICGLGTGAHFEHWGFLPEQIIEMDWNEDRILEDGFVVHSTPARHFSGRGLARNKSLWLSFVLQTPSMKIFVGGDSGFDTHFEEIGKKYGPIDLAIIENGQYNVHWRNVHLLPGEQVTVAQNLQAKRVFPVHSSKFALGYHAWDEPLVEIAANFKTAHIPLVTPLIGELVYLKDSSQQFSEWWKNVK